MMQAWGSEQPLQGANSDAGDIRSSYWAEQLGLTLSGLISIFYISKLIISCRYLQYDKCKEEADYFARDNYLSVHMVLPGLGLTG